MATKIDIYGIIHKAQRQHLFELSAKAGKIDVNDLPQVAMLKLEISAMIEHLRGHVQHEEQFVHPLFAKYGNEANILHHEHEILEKMLEDLERKLERDSAAEIYPVLNRFIAIYLQHIDAEEIAQVEILWKHCSDEEVLEAIGNFQKSLTPKEVINDLKFIFPCLNIHEIREMLSEIKAQAPKDFFQTTLEIARNALSDKQIHQLEEFFSAYSTT